jgi:phospholipid/cholesterol/gamma-HCH transport system ATP-binding protein
MGTAASLVRVLDLTMAFGPELVQRDLTFDIRPGEVLAIVGPSGCGKSTLLRHLIGLEVPARGRVLYGEHDLNDCDDATLAALRRQFGMMFQAGALWSSMTVGENIMLPLSMFTRMDAAARERQARFKLALVGLDGSFELEPAALSGGMRKRAAIARALALDPQLLYLDEPASGLDPFSTARLDELILNLRTHLGTTVVMVSHTIDSVFVVADRMMFLDPTEKTMTALDAPQTLAAHGPERVREFLRRKERPA